MVKIQQFPTALPPDPRAAQAQAELQAQQYQQQLAARQAVYSAPVQPGVAPEDRLLNPDGTGKNAIIDTNAADARAQQMQGAKVDANGNPTAVGLVDQYMQNAALGKATYNPQTGMTTNFDPRNPTGYIPQGAVINGGPDDLQARLDAIQKGADQSALRGVNYDVEGMKQTAIQQWQAEQQAKLFQQQQANLTGQQNAVANNAAQKSGKVQTAQVSPQASIQNAALAAYASTLPPELQGVAQALLSGMSAYDQGIQAQGALGQFGLGQAQQTYDKQEGVLGILAKQYQATKDQSQALLDKVKEDQQQTLIEQKELADQQLVWAQGEGTRRLQREKQKVIDSKVAQLALEGGFGSDGGLREIEDASYQFESAIVDLQKEYGFKRADLSINFTAQYNAISTDHAAKSLQNIKDFNAEMERLSFQSLANTKAKADAEMTTLQTMISNQTNLRIQAGKDMQAVTKDIYSMIQARDAKKSQAQDELWQRMMQHRAMDGDMAPGITKQIVREMQAAGMNVTEDMFSGKTVAQVNEEYRRQHELDQEAEDRRRWETEQTATPGKPLNITAVNTITDYDKSVKEALGMQALFSSTDGNRILEKVGPVAGRMNSLNPYDEDFKLMQQQLALAKQIIGKAFEGGVLRKEDEIKYKDILPLATDTPDVIRGKVKLLVDRVQGIRDTYLDNLQDAGYDVSRYQNGTADPLIRQQSQTVPDTDADAIMDAILNGGSPSAFLDVLASAHQEHEGFFPGSRAQRNNNPGNLKYIGQAGATGKDKDGFAIFGSLAAGAAALKKDLAAKIGGKSSHIDYSKNPTFGDYVAVYAPKEDRNDPKSYAQALVKKLRAAGYNVSADTPLSELATLLA